MSSRSRLHSRIGGMTRSHRLALIGAPTSAGAYAPGQEKAPAAFRQHGIAGALRRAGWVLRDAGDVEGFRWRPDPERPSAANLETVARVARAVADAVAHALRNDERVLVLGGDCTIELGTVAGAATDGSSIGLVYVDLDTDLNPPATSDGALDWTGVAHLLDLEGVEPTLSALGGRRPLLADHEILFLAPGQITPPEQRTIDARGLRVTDLATVRRDPQAAARDAVAWAARFDRLLVHLDVDVLAFAAFPIAENVRRVDGLTLAELAIVIRELVSAPNWTALTVTEVNPDHVPVAQATFGAFIAMLEAAFTAATAAAHTRARRQP
jgi:arginase